MYAIVESGNKQYRVNKNDIIGVENLNKKSGNSVKLENVLLASDGKKVHIGSPYLKNVSVNCEVLGDSKAKKVIAFKYKKRKGFKKKIGHRQLYTRLKVKEIKIG